MRRAADSTAATAAVLFLVWGLSEAGFWWAATRWALATAGPAAGGALVTARAVGVVGLGYALVGALVGLFWGCALGVVARLRGRGTGSGTLFPLRAFCSLLALGALVLWLVADRALAQHPQTTQNPAWFTVPFAARVALYVLICWGIYEILFFLGDRLTRPRPFRWLRHRWIRSGLAGVLATLALVLLLVPGPTAPATERELPARPAPRDGMPNVVVIVLDTVRPDHTSLYGYPRATTPTLDALAREGTVFDRAYSTSSWTLPAHASLFTGLYPSEHGATGEHFWLDDRFPTLAERMRALGYRTWAASGNPMVGPTSNLDRGFERFRESWRGEAWTSLVLPRALARIAGREPDEGARESTAQVVRWIREEGRDGPFFLFVNLIEAHAPYAPPEPYRDRFLEGRPAPDVDIYGNRFLDYMLGRVDVGAEELDGLRRLYDGEIAYVDARVGEMVAALRGSGLADRTLLVVLADHGENLGEHRLMDHQLCVYETLTRIPLLMVGPGVPKAARIGDPVQIHDVFATVLAAAGDGEAPRDERGPHDLASIARRESNGRDWSISEYHRPVAVLGMLAKKLEISGRSDSASLLARFDRTLRAVVRGSWKLVRGTDGKDELYDLASDPAETRDLAGEGRAEEAQLVAFIDAWVASLDLNVEKGGAGALHTDDQARERLRALGYIE